ncbi:hypothetical protein QJS10_CPB19g01941 [Acorus calamus]|uniref:tyrosine--tRNA ligase n=1 Tax=Acorus calamus TaxID=4465 RepID=A0AAV9CHS7_ACOCL|nr:hypothetical protein QJS10_CPB19g01941 [Acorus calamus]
MAASQGSPSSSIRTATASSLSHSETLKALPFPSFEGPSHAQQALETPRTDPTPNHRPNVVDFLQDRGLIESITSQSLRTACADRPLKVYCGFGPTAESLHLGNLLGSTVLSWCGQRAVALIGGATARVGDPSGKSLERPELDVGTVERNSAGIETIINQILGANSDVGFDKDVNLDNGSRNSFEILNNYGWWKEMGVLDFLKEVGRFARVGTMIAKESVKKQLASEGGMSYTEFTYQLLQDG